MDRRAAEINEKIRKARRSKLACAVQPVEKRTKLSNTMPVNYNNPRYFCLGSKLPFDHFPYAYASIQLSEQQGQRNTSTLDDSLCNFSPMLSSGVNNWKEGTMNSSFLEEVLRYIQVHNLPFEYVDVWIPSFAPGSKHKPQSLRLFHAGHTTTHTVRDPVLFSKLHDFGQYSSTISLESGQGLAGRVFAIGRPVWQRRVDEAAQKVFERADAAKAYGVITAVGIPIYRGAYDCVVVAMYSVTNLTEDWTSLEKWSDDLSKVSHRTKWTLEFDAGCRETSTRLTFIDPTSMLVHVEPSNHASPITTSCFNPQVSVSNNYTRNFQVTTKMNDGVQKALVHDEESCISRLLECNLLPGSAEGMSCPELSEESFHSNLRSLHFVFILSTDLRTPQEEELIAVIRESYRSYSESGFCNHRDIVQLLVQEWFNLNNPNSPLCPEDNEGTAILDFQAIDWDWESSLDFCLSASS
jgi:hypothetical protein